MTIDATSYRSIIGQFATGVTVVTTAVDGMLHGITANALTSVSLDPLLLLVCVDKEAHGHQQITKGGRFGLNILSDEQEDISNLFATKAPPEQGQLRGGVPYRLGPHGTPLLEDCLAYVECDIAESHEGGDHTIFIGQVLSAETLRDVPPLLFFQGRYRRLQP